MAQVKQGDTVRVHYTGRLDDDTTFDSSVDGEPLEFTIGAGQIIPGFEAAVMGMQPGESKTVIIEADEAYGEYQPEMVLEVDRGQFPPDAQPAVGEQYQIQGPTGEATLVTVTDIEGSSVTLDANHPLAGQDLTFEIELVEIV